MNKKSRINDIFPILLFLTFTLSALGVVLFTVQIYQKILARSEGNFETETAVLYMTEKFRSHDKSGSIETSEFKGHDAIMLTDIVMDEAYVTCIYSYDGYLWELYTEESLLNDCSEDSGTKILEMSDFSAEKLSDRLIHLEFTDNKGKTVSTSLSVQSGGSSS